MPLKSREGKLPPANYYAQIFGHLTQAYPAAQITPATMASLKPAWDMLWQAGRPADVVAKTTCSCDGKKIIPSPAVGLLLAKGLVRPPKGAQRGEVFGAEELREPAPVERLQKRLVRVSREQEKTQAVSEKWGQRAQGARKESTRDEAERRRAGATSRYDELRSEAQRIEAELTRLRGELSRTPRERIAEVQRRMPALRAEPPPPPPPPPPPEPPPSPPPADAPPKKPRALKGRPKKEATPTDADAAMLTAIQNLLPGIAGQLSTLMVADEEKAK